MGIEENDNGQWNGSMVDWWLRFMGMGNRMQAKMQANALLNISSTLHVVGITGMAGVAQLVELWIVIPVVEGSSPFARPSFFFCRQNIQ